LRCLRCFQLHLDDYKGSFDGQDRETGYDTCLNPMFDAPKG